MLNLFLKDFNLNTIFYDKDLYFAHRKNNECDNKETIYEHSLNTLIISDYFLRKNNYLIINKINSYLEYNSKIFNFSKNESFEFILNSFYLTVLCHDLGKYNPLFQKEKMDNKIINNNFDNSIIDSNHSNYSNIINILESYYITFINKYKNINIKQFDRFKNNYFLMLENLITKHHSGLENINNSDKLYFNNQIFDYDLTFILELLYSILIQSDILSTSYYMLDQIDKLDYTNINKVINIFNSYLDNKLVNINKNELRTIETKRDYNKYLYSNIKKHSIKEIENTNNLNDLKYKTMSNIIASNNFGDIKIFKGNLGIGKTNISMIYANELSKVNDYSKIIYVLPLNTLVDQTYYELHNNFNFINNKVSIVNSEQHISKKDNPNYWSLKYDFDNFNNDIVLTTSVNFFHKLIHKNKVEKLSLINLQNSLIIIDEIQLLNDNFFNIIYKYLLLLKDYLNVKILILTATLPIPIKFKSYFENNYILENDVSNSIYNHKLLNRVEFNYDNFKDDNQANFIVDTILNSNKNNFLIVHNNIKKCNNLFKEMENYKDEFKKLIKEEKIKIFFYNNTIIKPILNDILTKIRNNNTIKIVVISTQKIETGVDISFDMGFKFISSIDNIIQMSGRINRYCKEDKGNVFILKDNIKIFGNKQKRDNVTKDNQNNINFIKSKLDNVDSYYSAIFNNNSNDKIEEFYKQINCTELDKLKLIEDTYIQKSFFVHTLDVKEILNNKDLKIYEKYFNNQYDNEILYKEYTKTYFYVKDEIKYLFNLFLFKGYVDVNSNFYKNLSLLLQQLIHNKNDELIENFYIISKDNYFYNLEKGLDTNTNIDIDDIEDMINNL